MAWFAGLTVIVAIAEYFWPAGETPTMSARIQNLTIVFIAMIVLGLLNVVLNPIHALLVEHGLIGMVFGGWRPSGASYISAALIYAFVWDFFQYWFHRAEHTFAFLWPVHALHHDEEYVNATTSQRNTVWSGLLHFFLVHIPTIMICGLDLITIYGAIVFFRLYGFFNHANLRLHLGPFTAIISGPQWHRLHHGRDSKLHNQNFAAFFPIFDLVFGTYRHPARDEFPATGLADRPQAPLGALQVFRDVFAIGGNKPAEPPVSQLSQAAAQD
jgi:sterol desaturase/sphingolipid hydroxylase (fatty acid hydroxylase superfamily)